MRALQKSALRLRNLDLKNKLSVAKHEFWRENEQTEKMKRRKAEAKYKHWVKHKDNKKK